MAEPLQPIGPESFAQLSLRLDQAGARHPSVDAALLENLLHGQQEIFELVLSGAGLDEVLVRLAATLDRVVAPARCSISLFDAAAGRLRHHAAARLGPELKPGSGSPDHMPGPIEAALVQGERVVASDFQIEPRWPIYAGKALVRGLRACWAEPVDCSQGLAGVMALFHAEPVEPTPKDDRNLKALASVAAFAIKTAQRRQAHRSPYPSGPSRPH